MGHDRHCRCFAFEADFTADLRCIPMAVRRKLDLAGVKVRLSHWHELSEAERQQLLAWPDDSAALETLHQWLLERTSVMADGRAKLLAPAVSEPWQRPTDLPQAVIDSCRQLGLPPPEHAWGRLDELERFALMKLSHPGHEHRNLPVAMAEFGLMA
jgi:hypothetical protein